jgi:hypothetical protein
MLWVEGGGEKHERMESNLRRGGSRSQDGEREKKNGDKN